MADQRKMIEDYLIELSLTAEDWVVIKPVYGDVRDEVQLQKKALQAKDVKEVSLNLPMKDLEDLPPAQIKKRILDAISKAVKRY